MGTTHDGEVGEREARLQVEEALLAAKARRVLASAKRSDSCTPMPAWKAEEGADEAGPSRSHDGACRSQERLKQKYSGGVPMSLPVAAGGGASARKLGADLWGIQEVPVSWTRRRGARDRHCRRREEQPGDLSDLSPLGPYELIQQCDDLGKHATASMMQHRKSSGRNVHDLQPVSPVSYSCSTEFAARNHAATPTGSLEFKGGPRYSIRTSMELLRVLNNIWSLEEQHASSMSLVKTLKLELEHAHRQVQELLQEKHSDHHEVDLMMKHTMEDKLPRKSQEQVRIKVALQSVKEELEGERRLRRLSEDLHRKLAKELSEVKSAFRKTLKDLEREKKAHNLLVHLCDEIAQGVREYEQEVRELKQKPERGCDRRSDRWILHISEAWLDERQQIKLAEAQGNLSERSAIISRLTSEIETFLQARRVHRSSNVSLEDTIKNSCLHRHSLESIHLNGAASAPQDAEDEDSVTSSSHCFELNMSANTSEKHNSLKSNGLHIEKLEARKYNATKKLTRSSVECKYQSSPNSLIRADGSVQSYDGAKAHFANGTQKAQHHGTDEGGKDSNHADAVVPRRLECDECPEETCRSRMKQKGTRGSYNSSTAQMEVGDIGNAHLGSVHKDDLWPQHPVVVGRHSSSGDYHSLTCPEKQWACHRTSSDIEISECSSRLQDVKQSSLKAKLLEARLQGRHARLRLPRASQTGV